MASEQTLLKALNAITTPTLESIDEVYRPRAARPGMSRALGSRPGLMVVDRVTALRASRASHVENLRSVLASPNVVGVGIAEKVIRGRATGKLALTFYVERKRSLRRIKASEAVPPALPESIGGPEAIPTDVVVLGRLRPELNVTRSPIQPGNSVGHYQDSGGTLGAIVVLVGGKSTSRAPSRQLLLSNSHVLAKSGTARVGDHVIYPGVADGGKPSDRVGKLARFVKFDTTGQFVNTADCAIAAIDSSKSSDVDASIKGIGLPVGIAPVKRGMKVMKVGRTSGKTFGTVRDIHFRFVIDYPGVGKVGFVDQVLCTRYTKPGDSGSLVLDKKTRRAVGLHFAGASGGSVFNPIAQVLSGLKVRLVTIQAKKRSTS